MDITKLRPYVQQFIKNFFNIQRSRDLFDDRVLEVLETRMQLNAGDILVPGIVSQYESLAHELPFTVAGMFNLFNLGSEYFGRMHELVDEVFGELPTDEYNRLLRKPGYTDVLEITHLFTNMTKTQRLQLALYVHQKEGYSKGMTERLFTDQFLATRSGKTV